MISEAKGNIYAGIACVLIAAYYIYESLELPFWSEVGPGAGTLPLLSGAIFGLLAVILILQNRGVKSDQPDQVDFTTWRASAIIMGGLFLAVLLTKSLGMILIILIYMLLHTMVVERVRWKIALPASGITTVVLWFLFERLLDVPLVIGVFGI